MGILLPPPPANNVNKTDNEKTKVLEIQKTSCTKTARKIATYAFYCESLGSTLVVTAGGECSATAYNCDIAQATANECATNAAAASLAVKVAEAQAECSIPE